jgi:hypothetical protein
MTPQFIVSVTGGSTPTSITIAPGLRSTISDGAVITFYVNGTVNLSAGYAAGWNKAMTVATFTVAPKVGQLLSTGATAILQKCYSVIPTTTTTSLILNRSLDSAVANTDILGLGPTGEYNFGFHKNAIALVTRPLAQPRAGAGALSHVASYNGLSIRVTIAYDSTYQGHRVTVDLLAGVKTLDTNLGVVMLG